MEAMTFICASCRVRIFGGFPPWEDCAVCAKVNAVLADAPPYQPPDEPPPYYQPPARLPYTPPKPEWHKPRVWWPMRERKPGRQWLNPQTYGYEGKGDPQLPTELFTDYTISHELHDKMQTQLEVAFDLSPEDDWCPLRPETPLMPRKRNTTLG
jgi:hypothetical protein